MGHEVEDEVDAEGVGAGFGEEFEVGLVLAFAFPAVAGVGVVDGEGHDALLVVEPGADVHLLGAGAAPGGGHGFGVVGVVVAEPALEGGDLEGFHGPAQVEDAVEEGMFHGQFAPGAAGEDVFHMVFAGLPGAVAPEIVEEEDAAVEEVLAESAGFVVVEVHAFGVREEDEGVLGEVGVGEADDAAVGVGGEGGHLLETPGEVEVGVGVVVDPAEPAGAVKAVAVKYAGEGEGVLLEAGGVGPDGGVGAVIGGFAGGADSVFVDEFAAFGADERAGIVLAPEAAAATTTAAELCEAKAEREKHDGDGKEDSSRGAHGLIGRQWRQCWIGAARPTTDSLSDTKAGLSS